MCACARTSVTGISIPATPWTCTGATNRRGMGRQRLHSATVGVISSLCGAHSDEIVISCCDRGNHDTRENAREIAMNKTRASSALTAVTAPPLTRRYAAYIFWLLWLANFINYAD